MVLIESDWNLKMLVRRTQDEIDLVLIESDWNLKEVNTADGIKNLLY